MKVQITETAFRDAHQSKLATRMKLEDMLPIAEKIDKIGFFSIEMWGGATFDSCIRFLNEDPWERIKQLKKLMPNTKLQMLLRGQNLVGYRHYADDVVEKFVELSANYGIDIFRIFDALNDFRNIESSIKAVKKNSKLVEGCICYTTSPVHTIKSYVKMAKELDRMGSDIICIKDMAGLLTPDNAYKLVKKIKKITDKPVNIHAHCSCDLATTAYYKAMEAGASILDTAISPLALGPSQPPTETVVSALKGTKHDTNLDLDLLREIACYFKMIMPKYKEFESKTTVDPRILSSQIPGGMLSNLEKQLKEQKAADKFDEVLKEVQEVRKDLGYPPLVTPTSQIVGVQAVVNVMTKERYKIVIKEVKEYFKGMYGKPPGKINKDLQKKVLGKEEPVTCRPADTLEPELEKAKKELGEGYSIDDIVTYAVYPLSAKEYFKNRTKSAL